MLWKNQAPRELADERFVKALEMAYNEKSFEDGRLDMDSRQSDSIGELISTAEEKKAIIKTATVERNSALSRLYDELEPIYREYSESILIPFKTAASQLKMDFPELPKGVGGLEVWGNDGLFDMEFLENGCVRLFTSDRFRGESESCSVTIPFKYLSEGGIDMIRADAKRIGSMIAERREAERAAKSDESEKRERAEYERLRKKFG